MVALPELLPFMLRRGGNAASLEEEFNVAFPFTAEENFETGTVGIFTETDTLGRLTIIGPTDAHEIPPYLGGYVCEVDLNRGVTTTIPDAYMAGNSALSFGTGSTRYARLMVYLSEDLKVPGANDSVRLLQLLSGSSAEEAAIGLVRGNKGELMLGIFSPDLSGWVRGIEVDRGMWLPLEIAVVHAGTTSRLQVMCLGSQVESTAMNWATLNDYRLGSISQSLDIRGKVWFDHWVVDSADRLVAPQPLDPRALDNETILLTKSGYAFVGAGMVNCATLIAGSTDNAVYLYDTDRLPFAHHDARMSIKAAVAEMIETKGPRTFKRGCYVSMSGTNPQVIVQLGGVTEFGWGSLGSEGFAA